MHHCLYVPPSDLIVAIIPYREFLPAGLVTALPSFHSMTLHLSYQRVGELSSFKTASVAYLSEQESTYSLLSQEISHNIDPSSSCFRRLELNFSLSPIQHSHCRVIEAFNARSISISNFPALVSRRSNHSCAIKSKHHVSTVSKLSRQKI